MSLEGKASNNLIIAQREQICLEKYFEAGAAARTKVGKALVRSESGEEDFES